MEIDLGLKITRDTDHQSSTDFHIARDRAGPVFVSTETESVFILSAAHLKGFEKENIKIKINGDGTRMIISGEKLVSETIMSGWRLYKREDEVKGFSKTFKIPNGVILDKIRAKFGEENSSLTIYMPKSEKGIRGNGIEEVKEGEEDGERATARSQDTKLNGHGNEELLNPAEKKHGDEQLEKADENENNPMKKLKKHPQKTEGESEEENTAQESPEIKKPAQEDKPDADVNGTASKQKTTPGDQGSGHVHAKGEASKQHTESAEKPVQKESEGGATVDKKSVFVAPRFLMGSALIASLVVIVVGWVRTNSTKKQ